MKQKFILILPVVLLILGLDHLSKWLIDSSLPIGAHIPIWDGFFDIVHVRNKGAAFGFLAGAADSFRLPFFYGSAAIALLFLLYYMVQTSEKERGTLAALGLILGGALGNVSDRFIRGSVVDFLSFHWKDGVLTPTVWGQTFAIPLVWPAFNVADSAITVGVIVLLITTFKMSKA